MPYKLNPLTGKLDYYETGEGGGSSGLSQAQVLTRSFLGA